MGFFSRKAAQPAAPSGGGVPAAASGPVQIVAEPAPTAPAGTGPFDVSEVSELGTRVDLGALRVPVIQGMQVRMEMDRATQAITGVTLMVQQPGGVSALQLQAFAAPKSFGIWDEIRGEIAQGITNSGGTADEVTGEFGPELVAQIPRATPGGSTEVRKARFVGHDGPRWFLRGVITGPAAGDPEAAKQIEDLFRNIVVLRGDAPKPPRDLLPLSLPGQAEKLPGEPVDTKPNIDPMKRGPEIAEVR